MCILPGRSKEHLLAPTCFVANWLAGNLRICLLLLLYRARSGGMLQAAKQYEAAAVLFRKQLSARNSAQAGPSQVNFLMEQACLAYQAVADWSSLEDLIEVNCLAIEAWMLCQKLDALPCM